MGSMLQLRSDGAVPVIELVARPPVDSPGGLGLQRTVSVPLSSLGEILLYFERRLGLAHAKPDTDPVARYVACVTALAGQEKHRELSDVTGNYGCSTFDRVRNWYIDAGVSHEETNRWSSGEPIRTGRHVLLRARPEAGGGYNRTLYLELFSKDDPAWPHRLTFHESYQRAGAEDRPCCHSVEVKAPTLDPLVAALEIRLDQPIPAANDDQERRLVAAFTALLDRGELGVHLPYRQNRDRVHAWYTAAGLTCRLSGTGAHRDLLGGLADLPDGDRLSQQVSCWTPNGDPVVEFSQHYYPRADTGGPVKTSVRTPLSSLDPLLRFLEQRLNLPAGSGTEDGLLACFTVLVERGELGTMAGAGRAAPDNAARVAELFATAGVPYEVCGERAFPLLYGYREQGAGYIALNLTVETRTVTPTTGPSAVRFAALLFTEHYDYPAVRGDAGREYGYHAKLAHTPMEPLVTALEQRLGLVPRSTALDERLVDCFRALVTRGELRQDMPIEANRDRVAAILSDLGEVTAELLGLDQQRLTDLDVANTQNISRCLQIPPATTMGRRRRQGLSLRSCCWISSRSSSTECSS